MSLKVNLAQINSAARGNSDLRETLTSIHLALQTLYAQTGSAPLDKVDSKPTKFLGPPAPCGLSVVGGNGTVTVTITLPQSGGGSSAPANSTNAPIYQELSSCATSTFATNVTTYPLSVSTSYFFTLPGQTLYWRLRSSYDQKTFNSYSVFSRPVSAGLQTSAATQPNVSLNQSNFCTVDSIGAGATATVRAYGSGGPGSNWTSILGTNSKVIPGGTVLNIAYGSNLFVAWDGAKYQVKPALTQVFPDGWIPAGRVSVISSGAGLTLPTFHAVVSSGSIVAISTTTAGSGMTAAPAINITDSTGSGATATCTISGGSVNGVTVTNAGSSYSSTPTVTASGGVAGGVGGGGGPQGSNSGRIYSTGANG